MLGLFLIILRINQGYREKVNKVKVGSTWTLNLCFHVHKPTNPIQDSSELADS
jgi:hypothetical protein